MFEADMVEEIREYYQKEGMSDRVATLFLDHLYRFYEQNGRTFPWRDIDDPYGVLVSEIMLQQTQTERVRVKFPEFMESFPTVTRLASSPFQAVLDVWQGLGYNRRALSLHKTARIITEDFDCRIPDDPEQLVHLPGIGKATSASIAAFAYNKPVVFIETNIRTVFIYFFFSQAEAVTDRELFPLIEQTLDRHNSGMWYSALMDYGVYLKKEYPELNKKSAHYSRQSPFQGSNRQVRGKILKLLLKEETMTVKELQKALSVPVKRLEKILDELLKEGFLAKKRFRYYLSDQ